MNKIYRLKLNDERRLVVVSELATRASSIKGSKKKHQQKSSVDGFLRATSLGLKTLPLLLASFSLLGGVGLASAHSNPTVISGNASFNTKGNITTIHNSPNTIINWQDFNISQHEVVEFIQENSSSAVLNRVLGGEVTKILGELKSNGKVFVVNPAGIVFGKGANINVQSLVASSLDIKNSDFTAGNYRFTGNNTASGRIAALATVINQGLIKVGKDGKVALLGGQVVNEGIIKAQDGEVLLLAGKSIELSDLSNPRITYRLTAGNKALNIGKIISGRTTMLAEEVVNAGSISATKAKVGADGGIYLFADQAELPQTAGNNVASKNSVYKTANKTTNNNSISTSSKSKNSHLGRITNKGSLTGKTIVVKGKEVHFTKDSSLVAQARGKEKATILVGEGSLLSQDSAEKTNNKSSLDQEKGLDKTLAFSPQKAIKEALTKSSLDSSTIQTEKLLVEEGATIIARRLEKYNQENDSKKPSTPAKVNQVFLAAKESYFGGKIVADQGFVETSGKKLAFSKGFKVNTKGGIWLMDPYDIFITHDTDATFIIEKGMVIDSSSHFFSTGTGSHYHTYDPGSNQSNSILTYNGNAERPPQSNDEYYYAEVTDSFIEEQLTNNHVVIFTKEGNIGGSGFSIASRSGKNLSLVTRSGAIRFTDAHFILTNLEGTGQLNLVARDGIYLSSTAIDTGKIRLYAQGSIVINNSSIIKGVLDLKATAGALSTTSNLWADSGLSNTLAANNAPGTLWRRFNDYALVIEDSELINKGREFSTLYTDKKAYFDNIDFVGDSTYIESSASNAGPVITNRTKKSSEEIKELLKTKEAGFVTISAKSLQFSNLVNVEGTYVKVNSNNRDLPQDPALAFVKGTVFQNTDNGYLTVNAQGIGTLTKVLAGTGANTYINRGDEYPLTKDEINIGRVTIPTYIDRPVVPNNTNPLGVTFQGTNFNFYFKELKSTPLRTNDSNKAFGDLSGLKLNFQGASVNFNLLDEAVSQSGAEFSTLTLGALELDNSTVKFNGDNLSAIEAMSTLELNNNSNLTIIANRLALNDKADPRSSLREPENVEYLLSSDSVLNLGGYLNKINHISFNTHNPLNTAATVGKVNLTNYPNGSIRTTAPLQGETDDPHKNTFSFTNSGGVARITTNNLDNSTVNFYRSNFHDSNVNLLSDKAEVIFDESRFSNSELVFAGNNITVNGLDHSKAYSLRRGPNRSFDNYDLSLVNSNLLITNDVSTRRGNALTAAEQLVYPANPDARINFGGITIQNTNHDSTVTAFGRTIKANNVYYQGRALSLSAAQVNLEGSWNIDTAVNAEQAVILPGTKVQEDYKEGLYVHGQDLLVSATIEANNTLDLHGSKSLKVTRNASLEAKDIYLGDYRGNASYQENNQGANAATNPTTSPVSTSNGPSLAESAVYTIEVEGNIEASHQTTFRNSLKVKNVKLDSNNYKLSKGSSLTLDNANFSAADNLELSQVSLTKNSVLKAADVSTDSLITDNSLIYANKLEANTINSNNNSAYSIADSVNANSMSVRGSTLSALNLNVRDKLLAQEQSNLIVYDTVTAKNALFFQSQLTTEDYQGDKLTAANSHLTVNDESQVKSLSLDHSHFAGKNGSLTVSDKLTVSNDSVFESGAATVGKAELANSEVKAINLAVSGDFSADSVELKANKLSIEPSTVNSSSSTPSDISINITNSSIKTLESNTIRAEEANLINSTVVSPKVDWNVNTLNVDQESSIATEDFNVDAKDFNVEDLHSINAKKIKLFCTNSPNLNCNSNGRDSLFEEEEVVLDIDLSKLLGFNLSTVFSSSSSDDDDSGEEKEEKSDDKDSNSDGKQNNKGNNDNNGNNPNNEPNNANPGLDKTPEQRAQEKQAKRQTRRAKRQESLAKERKVLDKSAEVEEKRIRAQEKAQGNSNAGNGNSNGGAINSNNSSDHFNAEDNQGSQSNSGGNTSGGSSAGNNTNANAGNSNTNNGKGNLNNGTIGTSNGALDNESTNNVPPVVSRGSLLNEVNGLTDDKIVKENLTNNQVKQALQQSGFSAAEVSQSALNTLRSQGVSSTALPYGSSDKAFKTIAKVDVSSYFGVDKLNDQVNSLQSSAYRKPFEVLGKVNKVVNDLSSLPEKVTKGKEINFSDRNLQVLVESSSQRDISILNRAKKSPGKVFGVYGNIICHESKVKGVTAFCRVIDDKKPTGLTLPKTSK